MKLPIHFQTATVEVWDRKSYFTPRFVMGIITYPCLDKCETMSIKEAPDVNWFNCKYKEHRLIGCATIKPHSLRHKPIPSALRGGIYSFCRLAVAKRCLTPLWLTWFIRNYIIDKQLHHCPLGLQLLINNLTPMLVETNGVQVMAWLSNYIAQFRVEAIIHPWPNSMLIQVIYLNKICMPPK